MKKLFILLATQRSGTNMLRGILNSHPEIHALPEVFHEEHVDSDWPGIPDFVYYEEYFLKRVEEDLQCALPANRKELVRSYFKMITQQAQESGIVPIIDVKYNSLHHADSVWRNPILPPVMMQIFKGQNFPIIHMHRRNMLGMAISLFRAMITKQYVVKDAQDITQASFKLNPEHLMHQINLQESFQSTVLRWIKDLDIPCLDIVYEDLFVDGPGTDFDPVPFNRIAEFLGVDPSLISYKPATKRLASRSYREEIENFDEVEKVLRGTPYHEMFIA